jgi:hypothetical protein
MFSNPCLCCASDRIICRYYFAIDSTLPDQTTA